ncbi:hypothetical protein Poli38472_004615 [Pythium oligandrum]|uniref:Uncharacterized protein n=1 Tax=Pythium oligandrum TaxID=41045 RepID=A0A8K1CAT1_PYTOL|nr:hypothetical protein Poli38472_004615 [Pythium oligandrum]|eukprot:TMW59546.1 hypothetical protein Poli38472_004615 [Pythium oligandrum]
MTVAPTEEVPGKPIPVHNLPDRDAMPMNAIPRTQDVFKVVPTQDPVVDELIGKFLDVYKDEVARTSLNASVLNVIKAETTGVRIEQHEKELDANGLGIEFVEEMETQQYRFLMLMKYHFQSSMLDTRRPYVSVMQLTMDCYNTNSADSDVPQLACDVLNHTDLPRRNESTQHVPVYVQRQIFHSAPAAFVHNHTLKVFYDAAEAQDLALDANHQPIPDKDTMHYVRFRVEGGSGKDCMVVIEHANGIITLRYQDTVCYEDDDTFAAEITRAFSVSKENLPLFVLIAAIAGAIVAMFMLWHQRRRQRSGYSYLHSNSSKLSHVPTQTTNTDAAIAC